MEIIKALVNFILRVLGAPLLIFVAIIFIIAWVFEPRAYGGLANWIEKKAHGKGRE